MMNKIETQFLDEIINSNYGVHFKNGIVHGLETFDGNAFELRDPYFFVPQFEFTKYGTDDYQTPKNLDISGLEELSPNFNFDTDSSVLGVFDGLVEDLEIDQRWLRKLRQYVLGFTTRNNDHTEFFGSPLLGTHRIIYKTSDRKDWFSDIIDIDDVRLKDEIVKCRWINPDFHVSSDVFNLSIVYLMYRVHNSKLPTSQKHEGLINLVMMFHYRILTSLMNHYFTYLVRKNVAQTAYNSLSLKFDIKRYGSWTELFRQRAEFIISKSTGIHYNTFTKMDDDKRIVYMINDMESRLKGVVNDYTRVLYTIKDSVDLVKTDNGLISLDGEVHIKDIQKNINKYKTYIERTLTAKDSFYKEDLVRYAIDSTDKTLYDKFAIIIKELPSLYNHRKGLYVREFVDNVTTHMFEYIAYNKIPQNDIKGVFLKMRGAYTSSKSTNELLYKLREVGDKIVKDITGIKTPIKVTSMRTSLMLYVVIRTLTMNYFN